MNRAIFTIIGIILATNTMAGPFTYDIQQAGYDFDQYDLKGEATYEIFIDEFQKFPWVEQVGKNTGGSEPTISVKNKESKIDYWVSVIGKPNEYAYLVGIVQPKMVKSMFGLGKEKEVRWVSIYVAERQQTVEDTFKLYFAGKIPELNQELSRLPLFLEQEAR
ncbi:hypothetical protein [Microbulbifer thermotolerans]|uniref:hypothetical protein n=1 Tax=Microbulbifer thermotolerans TaxID=252514 RepID=UPI0022499E48|nr:hypothetical protein [Microbulbifer thermotolerans]MCX2794683.1 hypothetical protein [Microbulbifer thermotolerans]MCX2836486.1 hypothetical protein [Microbulbifer thermotolerans]